MIDFTTIPLHEPLPDIKAANYRNSLLVDENMVLKRIILILVAALVVYWVQKGIMKKKKDADS